jgi:nicotinamidase/pyrazinamidase
MKKIAFMLIDYQNDFVHPEKGTLYVNGAEKLENTIMDLIAVFEKDRAYMIGTQDWHTKDTNYFAETHGVEPYTQLADGTIAWPRHCVANTFGAEFYGRIKDFKPDLLVRKGQTIEKENFSAFDKDPR